MLNSLDRRLILALQDDGRITNVELSRRIGCHISTINKRMTQLKEKELVKVRALPNPFKLGYKANALIAVKADSLSIDSICDSLASHFYVNLLVTTFGRYDILVLMYYPSWEDLLSQVATVFSKLDGIKMVDTYLIKEVKKRQYSFSGENEETVKIDDIDQSLIEKLTVDGRLTYRQLAQELGISPATCLRRVSRLLEEEVIEIKGVPYLAKIESVYHAFMFLHVNPKKLEEVCSIIQGYQGVFLSVTMINRFSLVIGFSKSTPEDLFQLKNKVLSLDGVVDGEVIVSAGIKKRYYGGFLK